MAVVEQGYRMVEVYGIRCLFASGILQQFQFRSVFLDSCHSQLVGSQQESRVNVDGVAQVFFALFFVGFLVEQAVVLKSRQRAEILLVEFLDFLSRQLAEDGVVQFVLNAAQLGKVFFLKQ